MVIYAIDPGTTQSALVVYDARARRVEFHLTNFNAEILECVRVRSPRFLSPVLAIETVEAMGMAVGREVFETVWWAGRFHEAWNHAGEPARVTRRQVKLHLCGSMKAKDPNIRQAILDRFGGSAAIGLKKTPGPLYGVKGHEFAALAVALTYADTVGRTAKGECVRHDISDPVTVATVIVRDHLDTVIQRHGQVKDDPVSAAVLKLATALLGHLPGEAKQARADQG